MSAVKMVVTGVKEFSNRKLICDILEKAKSSYPELTILNGGAKGVELIAMEWADMRGVTFEKHAVDWKNITMEGADVREGPYGKYNARAGLARNKTMLDAATHVLAFWDGVYVDTKIITEFAKKKGLMVKIFIIKGDGIVEYTEQEAEIAKAEESFSRAHEADNDEDSLDNLF